MGRKPNSCMKDIYNKLRDIINIKRGELTMSLSLPKIIYVDSHIKNAIEEKHPNIKELITEDRNADTIVFVVSTVPSPYVDNDGTMYLGEMDFNNLMPFLIEFFSSQQKGIPINEAFNILINRLTGE